MVERPPATDERASVRTLVFNHLAGIVLAPTVKALADRKVFDLLQSGTPWTELNTLVSQTHANRGYLRVALRLLACFGWLRDKQDVPDPAFALSQEGAVVALLVPLL